MMSGGTRAKGPHAFRTIGEAAEELGVAPHVLRFWEGKFRTLQPLKRAGNRRYYRPVDMELLRQIKYLLHEEGFTIKGAQKALRSAAGRDARFEVDDCAPTLFENRMQEETGTVIGRATRLQELATELHSLARECAIVAAGNPPPSAKD
jgi:DNA-binding transcriptional MerR regulator